MSIGIYTDVDGLKGGECEAAIIKIPNDNNNRKTRLLRLCRLCAGLPQTLHIHERGWGRVSLSGI